MSADYQKGRYDELVERYKELLEMYRSLQWNVISSMPRAGISGAQVQYYSGTQIDSKTVGWAIAGGGLTFSIFAYYFGLVPLTFGATFSALGLIYSILSTLLKKPEDKKIP
jgi:hypothetical protein